MRSARPGDDPHRAADIRRRREEHERRPRRPADAIRRFPKGEATRRRILDAAMLVVAEEGYHAATHQRIAQAAGLVRTAINYHFPDQDRLADDLVRHLYRLKAERVAAMLCAPTLGGPVSAIEAYWTLLRETPLVAIAELECCARTDRALRARLAAARRASGDRGEGVSAGSPPPEAIDPDLYGLSVYLLEGLARGGAREDGRLLERRILGLLKRAARAPPELEPAP